MGVGSDFDHLIARGVASVPPDTNIMAVTSYKNINSMVSRAVASMCNGGWIMVRNYRMRQLHTFLNCDFSGYEYFYTVKIVFICVRQTPSANNKWNYTRWCVSLLRTPCIAIWRPLLFRLVSWSHDPNALHALCLYRSTSAAAVEFITQHTSCVMI